MTDLTPVPHSPQDSGPPILSMEQIHDIQRRLTENKAAQLRGESMPHIIDPQELRDAISSIRRQRGTMNFVSSGTGKKSAGGKKSTVQLIDLDGL